MPLTAKGEEIKSALTKEYGEKKGEQVLYAGKNKGTFKGIDADSYVWKKQTGEDKWHIFENGKRVATVNSEKEAKEWIRSKRSPKLDSDKIASIADGVKRLSARFDAMIMKDERKPEDKLPLPPIRSDPRLAPYNVRKPSEAKPPGQNPKK